MQSLPLYKFIACGKVVIYDKYISNGAVITRCDPGKVKWLKTFVDQLSNPDTIRRIWLVAETLATDGLPPTCVFGPADYAIGDLVAIDKSLLDAVIDTSELGWVNYYVFSLATLTDGTNTVTGVAVYSDGYRNQFLGVVVALQIPAFAWNDILAKCTTPPPEATRRA